MAENNQTTPPWGECPNCKTNIRVRNRRFYCPKCKQDLGEAASLTPAKLGAASDYVSALMDKIKEAFKPAVKVTVMVRTPNFPDRDFMLTDDDISELKAMLERREKS